MTVATAPRLNQQTPRRDAFLKGLPTIEQIARFAHRDTDHEHDREDAIAETVATAWEWFLGLGQPLLSSRDAADLAWLAAEIVLFRQSLTRDAENAFIESAARITA